MITIRCLTQNSCIKHEKSRKLQWVKDKGLFWWQVSFSFLVVMVFFPTKQAATAMFIWDLEWTVPKLMSLIVVFSAGFAKDMLSWPEFGHLSIPFWHYKYLKIVHIGIRLWFICHLTMKNEVWIVPHDWEFWLEPKFTRNNRKGST